MSGRRPRGTYGNRNEIRRIAQRIADEIADMWPGSKIDVDIDTVDDEDAFLWITPSEPSYSNRVALTALERVNSLGARCGFWVVPRVLNDHGTGEPAHRLRLRADAEQKATLP